MELVKNNDSKYPADYEIERTYSASAKAAVAVEDVYGCALVVEVSEGLVHLDYYDQTENEYTFEVGGTLEELIEVLSDARDGTMPTSLPYSGFKFSFSDGTTIEVKLDDCGGIWLNWGTSYDLFFKKEDLPLFKNYLEEIIESLLGGKSIDWSVSAGNGNFLRIVLEDDGDCFLCGAGDTTHNPKVDMSRSLNSWTATVPTTLIAFLWEVVRLIDNG